MYSNAADAACLLAQLTKNKNVSPLTPLYALTHYFRCASATNTRDRYYKGGALRGNIRARDVPLFSLLHSSFTNTLPIRFVQSHTKQLICFYAYKICTSLLLVFSTICATKKEKPQALTVHLLYFVHPFTPSFKTDISKFPLLLLYYFPL